MKATFKMCDITCTNLWLGGNALDKVFQTSFFAGFIFERSLRYWKHFLYHIEMTNFNYYKKTPPLSNTFNEKVMKSAAVSEAAPIPLQVTPYLKSWILNHKWILPGMTWQCYWPILWGLTIAFHWMHFSHMVPGEVYRVCSILWWHLSEVTKGLFRKPLCASNRASSSPSSQAANSSSRKENISCAASEAKLSWKVQLGMSGALKEPCNVLRAFPLPVNHRWTSAKLCPSITRKG